MQKLKLNIKGMHCVSCEKLIEQNVKSLPGVLNVKVNKDSGKAVIIYEAGEIKKDALIGAVRDAGDYKVEEVEEKEEEEPHASSVSSNPLHNNRQFALGALAGLAAVSVLLNIVLGIIIFKAFVWKNNSLSGLGVKDAAAAVANPSNNTIPSPAGNQPSPIQNFTVSKNDHVRGDFNAPVTLVEFSDFECPFCGRFYPVLKQVMSDYKGKVRLVYKHFPLNIHPDSQKAAEASECADEQGKFWEFHDIVFENQAGGLSIDKFKGWAKDLGLDVKKFNDCLDTDKYAAKVQADYNEGEAKGVDGTPGTFINGQLVKGAVSYEQFKQLIDAAIK